MKKLLALLLVLATAFSFAACGGEESAVKVAVDEGLTAIKNFDQQGIEKYFVGKGLGEETLQATGVDQAKAIFSTLSWEIEEYTEEGNTAVATVEITAASFADVMNRLAKEVMEKAKNGEFIEDLDAYTLERMSDIVKDKDTKTVSVTVDFVLEKTDEQWKITNPDGILAVFTSGQ